MARTEVETDAFTGDEVAIESHSTTVGNWTRIVGTGDAYVRCMSNVARLRYGDTTAHRAAGTYSNDHYAKATIGGFNGLSADLVGLIVRAGSDAPPNGDFAVVAIMDTATPRVYTSTWSNGTESNTTAYDTSQAWANGDTLEVEAVGSDLKVYRNGSSTPFLTRTGILTGTWATGKPGIRFQGGALLTLDNFVGGDVTSSSSNLPIIHHYNARLRA